MFESKSAEVLARRWLLLSAADPMAADDAGATSLGVSVNATVNPVQTTTYHLKPSNNPITFGASTNIHMTASGQNAVVGGTSAAYTVTNLGVLNGTASGVAIAGAGATLTNSGSITGGSAAAVSLASGHVTNQTDGSIRGTTGAIEFAAGTGVVVNDGSISAGNGAGIQFEAGGSLTNAAKALVSGTYGVEATTTSVSIINSGSIFGADGFGVFLSASGSVNNKAGGLIGGNYGVVIHGVGSVQNGGTIEAYLFPVDGVGLHMDSGTVTNFVNGTITGAEGVSFGGVGTVTNVGVIRAETDTLDGVRFDGVGLGEGGVVTNRATGVIYGSIGVYGRATRSTITNTGKITGASTEGVSLVAGGTVDNEKGGVISGKINGVAIGGAAGTVTDAGKITGATDSVVFTGSGANQLILETGAVLSGKAVGSTASGTTDALILQGSGTVANQFQNFTRLSVDGAWTMFLQQTFGAASILGGSLQVGNASHAGSKLTIAGTLANAGVLEVSGGSIDVTGVVTGAGSAAIAAGELTFGATFTQNVAFTGTSGTLQLAKSQSYTGAVSGLSTGDALDLGDIDFVAGATKATFVENGAHTSGVLTVTDGSHTAHITLLGNLSGASFSVASAGGGTNVIESHPAASVMPLISAMAAIGAGGGPVACAEHDPGGARSISLALGSGRG